MKPYTRILFLVVILCGLTFIQGSGLWGQEAEEEAEPLPRGFEELQLGVGIDELKDALRKNGSFLYRGDPDVSMLERENMSLMEVEGLGFFASGQFQFSQDNRLFVIVLVMNDQRIDYFSLYSTLSDKYGPPTELSPQRAYWEDDEVRVSLERPLLVRYIDRSIFNEIRQEGEALKSYERITREEFLSRF